MTASAPQPRPVRRERRIIERPRLIKLLDETEARTILLLAPAGYGKTTLARQWAKTLQSVVWVSLTPRHHDVAWLAADIAEAIDREGDTASRAIAEHLKARSNPQRAARQLGVALAEQLNGARVQWLVLDDYHAIDSAAESEQLVQTVEEQTQLRLLIASRTRPDWVTSKRILYGEAEEITREELAMTNGEATQLLSQTATTTSRIAQQACGWPALVALAARVSAPAVPADVLPEALHHYLADELFRRASQELQENLVTLALLGDSASLAFEARFGADAARIAQEANALGFTSADPDFELHPLLREFLLEKLVAEPGHVERVRQALHANLAAGSWDQALDLIVRFKLLDAVEQTLSLAFKPLARSGRLGTLSAFAQAITTAPDFPPPSVEVVHAEVALREGNLELARELAERARAELGHEHALASRAAAIVGHASFFLAEFAAAEEAFTAARDLAQDERDETEALHGLATTRIYGESPNAAACVGELALRRSRSPIDFIRFVTADLSLRRMSQNELGLNSPLHADATWQAVSQVDDPRARTATTYNIAGALALCANYGDATPWLGLLFDDAEHFGLEFTLPFGNWVRAQVALGQRRFAEAERALQAIEDAAIRSHDRRHQLNAKTLRSRLLLQNGDPSGALDCVRMEAVRPITPSWEGEYLATRAMALACMRRDSEAIATASRAERASAALEVHLLAQVARTIARVQSADELHRLIEMATRSGIWDPIVCGVRSSVDLADALATDPDTRPSISELYRRTQDTALARRAGLRTRATSAPVKVLSAREFEVLGLIARGYRNRDISQALFIADSTTKVHIRHIFEKLGVRSRSAAVARFQMFSDGG